MAEIKELTGIPPLIIESTGADLLDWKIDGAAGGVGVYVTNYNTSSLVRINSGIGISQMIPVDPDTQYAIKIYTDTIPEAILKTMYFSLNGYASTSSPYYDFHTSAKNGGSFQTGYNTHYLDIKFGSSSAIWQPENITGLMLNKGSRAFPYCAGGESYYSIPLIVSSTQGTKENFLSIEAPLEAGESISLESDGTEIATFFGQNILTIETEVSPTLYVKYYEGRLYPAERPSQVSIYDIQEPQNGFDHNGLAVLMPSEIISMKEDKGRWDFTMKHPIDPYGKWTYIAGQNILKVRGQLYRIDQVEIIADANNEYVQAHANHITYDLRDWWIADAEFEAQDGNEYITKLNYYKIHDFPNQQAVVGEYTFDVTSDIDKDMVANIKDQTFIEALYGADNSFVSRYGGEVYRNNFRVSINETMQGAPEGNAFAIRYGTDMTKISFKIDYSNWITNLICVDNFGNLWGIWYGGEITPHHHKTKRVHFTYSVKDNNANEAMERLMADGMTYWLSVSTPQISIEVNVANIASDPKYADFLNLQNFDVGYTGIVYIARLGINVATKIVSIKRNELTGEVLSIKLGNNRRSLIRSTVMSQTIVSPNSVEGKNTLNNSELQQELYDTQTGLMGESIAGMEAFSINDLELRTINELEGQ